MYGFVIALLAIATVSADEPCTPGETKMDNCNRCVCLGDGSGYACTEMACAIEAMPRTADAKVCEPGQTKMEDCNSCFCIADGSGYVCTLKGCSSVNLTCEPGTSFKKFCNTCRCPNNGLRASAICTRMACPDGMWNEDGSLKNPRERRQANNDETCVLGESKMKDCNSCRCLGNPPRWACTKIGCY